MSAHLISQRFLRVAVVAFVTLAAAFAVIQSHPGKETTIFAPLESGQTDALVRELARCRTVTSNETMVLDACRRLWAENRQHFFASMKSPQLLGPSGSDAPAGVMKSEERIQPDQIEQGGTR